MVRGYIYAILRGVKLVSIEVDIRTRILKNDHRVYIVRPGAGYRLYNDVDQASAILFDLPGLELDNKIKFSNTPDLVAQVLRAQEIRQWHKNGRANGSPHPSILLADYPPPIHTADKRSLSQFLSIGRAYFERSKVGDMVIVPPLKFGDPVLVGEIVDDDLFQTTVPEYGAEPVYGRRVSWLARIPKNEVPARVIGISQKPNSFVLLERSSAVWFYDRAYKSYVLDDRYQSEFRITSEHFGSSDDARFTAFLNFVAANYAASKNQQPSVSIGTAVFADLGAYEPDQRIAINSPGEKIVYALKLTPLIFLSLMAMSSAASPDDIYQAAIAGKVAITNTAALPGDGCTAMVYQETVAWLKTIGAQEWLDGCAIAKQAIASAGIETPATVVVKP